MLSSCKVSQQANILCTLAPRPRSHRRVFGRKGTQGSIARDSTSCCCCCCCQSTQILNWGSSWPSERCLCFGRWFLDTLQEEVVDFSASNHAASVSWIRCCPSNRKRKEKKEKKEWKVKAKGKNSLSRLGKITRILVGQSVLWLFLCCSLWLCDCNTAYSLK